MKYLILNDVKTSNNLFKAGNVVDDAQQDINAMQNAGVSVVVYSDDMLPSVEAYLTLKKVQEETPASTLTSLLLSNQVFPQADIPAIKIGIRGGQSLSQGDSAQLQVRANSGMFEQGGLSAVTNDTYVEVQEAGLYTVSYSIFTTGSALVGLFQDDTEITREQASSSLSTTSTTIISMESGEQIRLRCISGGGVTLNATNAYHTFSVNKV